jgi:radical SAM protein with 4Fe4S-binding SPASM domain
LKLIRSPYLRSLYDDSNGPNRAIFYHTLFGNPRIFNEEAIRFINFFAEELDVTQLRKKVVGDFKELLNDLIDIHYLVPMNANERRILIDRKEKHLEQFRNQKTIDRIGLSVSNVCNFGCRHCIFFSRNKIYDSLRFMKWEIAKKCIDTYVSLIRQNGKKSGQIIFGNAEPLLNWHIIEKTLIYCENISDISFDFSMNTNLSLLNKKTAEKLKNYQVRIATSIDGLQDANDLIRITKNGKATFVTINKKMDLLQKIQYPIEGISITITDKNFNSIDTSIIDYALNRGVSRVACDFDLVNLQKIPVDDRVGKILALKAYANRRGLILGGTWARPFEKLMTSSLLHEKYAFCVAAEGRMIVFNPDQSIKICGYSGTRIGHLDQFSKIFHEGSDFYQLIENRIPGNNVLCDGCTIEGFCGGQCYPTMESVQSCVSLLKDMCLFYKKVTDALIQANLSDGENIPFSDLNYDLGASVVNADSKFNFLCCTDQKCSKKCCSNLNILLPPYDVLRIRKRLGLSFSEFLYAYGKVKILDGIGLPVITLRMIEDNELSCPFFNSSGCSIHSDRPSICRYYPLIPKQQLEVINSEQDFLLTKWHNCRGFGKAKEWTVREWRNKNEISLYDSFNNKWREIIKRFESKISAKKITNPSKEKFKKLFFLASYDLDKFRAYAYNQIMPKAKDTNESFLHMIKDDLQLIQFSFEWLIGILKRR